MTQFWAIIVDSFREALDRKIFWVLAGLSLLTVLGAVCIDFEADRVSLFFGATEIETDSLDPQTEHGRNTIILSVAGGMTDLLVGWLGVLLMIIATASFFPTMMEKGAIDVVLSKPISRPVLFLYKYVASMVFVLLQALLFVGLMFLVMGLRWGVWAPGYLWAIPLLVLLFSYVYCVSVFVGVLTRSALAAILLSLLAWILFVTPPAAREVIETTPGLRDNERFVQALRIAAWIPPKTGDLGTIATRLATGATFAEVFGEEEDAEETYDDEFFATHFRGLSPEDQERTRAEFRQQMRLQRDYAERCYSVSPYASIGSSLLFEAVFVGLALLRFWRRDF